ncbi:hypothetical protein EVA_12273 [gut metagenome]|uniref:Uncharacterized protein n=1 Tax=gut metagenome TaxID=749906 RepID=J9FYI0_9ZZZZ
MSIYIANSNIDARLRHVSHYPNAKNVHGGAPRPS